MTQGLSWLGQDFGSGESKAVVSRWNQGPPVSEITWDVYLKYRFLGPGPDLWNENLCRKGPGLCILTIFPDDFMYTKV